MRRSLTLCFVIAVNSANAGLLPQCVRPFHGTTTAAPQIAVAANARTTTDLMAAAPAAPEPPAGGAIAYSLYALGFAALLIKTLCAYPLIPPSPNSLLWCRAWLWTTVADYYGAALALCGIIVATEQAIKWRVAWCLGCLLGGTPFCCFWVAQRLFKGQSIRIA